MNAAGNSLPRFAFSASLVYVDFAGFRGSRTVGVRDWEMFRSKHLDDRLTFRAMTSLGSLRRDSAGIPALLQTGGRYRGDPIHDVQHPDHLIMEAATEFRLGEAFLYVAPIGAPALGPTPYMHRPSAGADPIAPLGHHWQDATHVSYGVVTVGARRGHATVEVSVFNARESDFEAPWPDVSQAGLDSYSGRLVVSAAGFSASSWLGYLKAHDPVTPAMQMHRYGVSLSFDKGRSSSIVVWGMNVHHHDGASHLFLHGDPNASPHARSSSLLLESTLGVDAKLAVFGRAETVSKSGEELGFQGGNLLELYEIRALSLGARRDVYGNRFVRLAVAARGSLTVVPLKLESSYGTRRPTGFYLYAQARRAP